MNLTTNSKFQQDYNMYSETISKIEDSAFKQEAQDLLNALTTRVRNIEKIHSEMITGNISALDSAGLERKKIIELRKSLDNMLKKVPRV